MKKEWWIIGALILIIILLIIVVIILSSSKPNNNQNINNSDIICGNRVCEAGETALSCSQDCNDNGPYVPPTYIECVGDSDCPAGYKCVTIPDGRICQLIVPSLNSGQTCTSDSGCPSGYICIRHVEGMTNQYGGVLGTPENPGNCIIKDAGISCTSNSQCSNGFLCWYQSPTTSRPGIPGSPDKPGVCSGAGVGNIQE